MAPKKKLMEKLSPGRPKHEVWGLGFRRVLKHCEKTRRTIHAAYCVICTKVLCNTASKRLTAHRRICSLENNAAAAISEEIDKNDQEDVKLGKDGAQVIAIDESTTIAFVDMDNSEFLANHNSGSEVTKTEFTFVDGDTFDEYKLHAAHIQNSNIDKLDLTIAKFFIGCNIPFSIADSLYFKKLCLSLNPNCKLVTSEQLSGPLLDTLYSKSHKDTNFGQLSVLLIDGWKNESTGAKNVTVMLKTESNETLFLDNYELSNNKDIVQELTDITKISIVEAYEQFKTEVYAVILGNSCSFIKMENVTDVWQFSCNTHVIKLIIKEYISSDFMNTLCKILKQVNTVFKDEALESKISSENRWSNSKCILDYCITNLSLIQGLLSSDNVIKLSKECRCLFFDDEFIHKIENNISFLNSVAELTMVCQMPKANISDTTEQWLSFQFAEGDPRTEKLISRRESAIKIQCLVANYLHPAYRGRKLSDDQMTRVEEFLLNELDSEGLNSLQAYVNGEGIFRALNQKEGLSAQTYWSLARRSHNGLSALALKLLAIPASINSNFSQIFSTLKSTSLKPDKMRKLFAVYYHLKEREDRVELE